MVANTEDSAASRTGTGQPGARRLDPAFTALPLRTIADAALARGRSLGASHTDVRVARIASRAIRLRDARPEAVVADEESGMAVRVIYRGAWGFAASTRVDPAEAARLADAAVQLAAVLAAVGEGGVELAPEPNHPPLTWISSYEVDPIEVPDAEVLDLLAGRSARLLAHPEVSHVDAALLAVRECTYYADATGREALQQRVRVDPEVTAVRVDAQAGRFDTLRTLALPAGRGWEYLTGTGWDWDSELAELPELLAEKARSTPVRPGVYDLVVDPTNLWLTIHESVGHATEYDRAIGYEANYAGTSFATPDQLGTLRYGSPAMTVTGDRTVEHGLATIGMDDDGVPGQRFELIREGVLVGYQHDRRSAALAGLERSNGCAFADSPLHAPIQRMANVSLAAAAGGPDTAELISGVDNGLYVVGDGSWSIDMQRYNFQFTAQRFYAIRAGRLAGQVRDAAYQSRTPSFWGSMEAVGGPQTYVLGGAFNCGKAQPGQVAAVSHGCPAALFRGVRVLSTTEVGQ